MDSTRISLSDYFKCFVSEKRRREYELSCPAKAGNQKISTVLCFFPAPLAERQRIVQELDALFARIDEANKIKEEKFRVWIGSKTVYWVGPLRIVYSIIIHPPLHPLYELEFFEN